MICTCVQYYFALSILRNAGRKYSAKLKYNVPTAERMTMKKLEHVVVNNILLCATTNDDKLGDVRNVHLGFQELHTTNVVSSDNKTMTSPDTN